MIIFASGGMHAVIDYCINSRQMLLHVGHIFSEIFSQPITFCHSLAIEYLIFHFEMIHFTNRQRCYIFIFRQLFESLLRQAISSDVVSSTMIDATLASKAMAVTYMRRFFVV